MERISMIQTANAISRVKPKVDIKITSTEFQRLIINAERYVIGRMTYAPHEVGEIIEKHLDKIENGTLGVLINDIEHQSKYEWGLGADFDKEMWLNLLETLKTERDKRKDAK